MKRAQMSVHESRMIVSMHESPMSTHQSRKSTNETRMRTKDALFFYVGRLRFFDMETLLCVGAISSQDATCFLNTALFF